jgi:AcrR family transcriptional regulator
MAHTDPMTVERTRRTQAERRESTRDRVERAALRAVALTGFEGATVDVIARESGMSRGAVSAHFPAKELLWPVVLDRAAQALERDAEQSFEAASGLGIARVRAALSALVAARARPDPEASAWPELLRRAARDPSLGDRLRPSLSRVEASIGERARALGEAAGLSLRVAPAQAGRAILAVVHALSDRARIDGGAPSAEDVATLSLLASGLWSV